MTFVVIYDANVLYPSTLRDVLIRLAQTGLIQAKWTETILDETFQSLHAKRPDLDETRLQRTRKLMNLAVRDAVVTGHEPLIGSLHLPDPDDRHVLAAAIRARAQIIVTFNLNDFPAEVLADWDVEAKHPDDFLVDQFHLDAVSVHKAVQAVADSWQRPPGTVDDVLDRSGPCRTPSDRGSPAQIARWEGRSHTPEASGQNARRLVKAVKARVSCAAAPTSIRGDGAHGISPMCSSKVPNRGMVTCSGRRVPVAVRRSVSLRTGTAPPPTR